MKKHFLTFLFVTVFSVIVSARALMPDGGSDRGGGGDDVVADFKNIGYSMATSLDKLRGALSFQITSDELRAVVYSIPIVPVYMSRIQSGVATVTEKENAAKLIIDGVFHTATFYYNSRKIYLDVEKFAAIQDLQQKQMLVLHEYLRALEKPDNDYLLTLDILASIHALTPRIPQLF